MDVCLSDLVNSNFSINSYAQLTPDSVKLFSGKSINHFLGYVAEHSLISNHFNTVSVDELINEYKAFYLFLVNGRVVEDFDYLLRPDDSLMFLRR